MRGVWLPPASYMGITRLTSLPHPLPFSPRRLPRLFHRPVRQAVLTHVGYMRQEGCREECKCLKSEGVGEREGTKGGECAGTGVRVRRRSERYTLCQHLRVILPHNLSRTCSDMHVDVQRA